MTYRKKIQSIQLPLARSHEESQIKDGGHNRKPSMLKLREGQG